MIAQRSQAAALTLAERSSCLRSRFSRRKNSRASRDACNTVQSTTATNSIHAALMATKTQNTDSVTSMFTSRGIHRWNPLYPRIGGCE